jgi:hypothetical protein
MNKRVNKHVYTLNTVRTNQRVRYNGGESGRCRPQQSEQTADVREWSGAEGESAGRLLSDGW